jgi:predicted DNA-binding transcriptional regulator YafY
MTYTQKERLRMIDCLIANYGSVGRDMLMDWFGVSPACATRDLALYKELNPSNVYFCEETKKWYQHACFKKAFP